MSSFSSPIDLKKNSTIEFETSAPKSRAVQINDTVHQIRFNPKESILTKPTLVIANPKEIDNKSQKTLPRTPIPNEMFFHTKFLYFSELKERVEKSLNQMENVDFSFNPDSFEWLCKYAKGSVAREIKISCYFDNVQNDHVLGVQRLKGTCLSSNCRFNFNSEFRNLVLTGKASVQKVDNSLNCNFEPISKEFFLEGLEYMSSLAHDMFFESRLEAVKMLCDLSEKSLQYLDSEQASEIIVKTLSELLNDDFEEVKEYSLMAIASFVEIEIYREKMIKFICIPVILGYIRNCTNLLQSYCCAQLRRKASYIIFILSKFYPAEIHRYLNLMGYFSKIEWENHANTLVDEKTREYSIQISDCFEFPVVSLENRKLFENELSFPYCHA